MAVPSVIFVAGCLLAAVPVRRPKPDSVLQLRPLAGLDPFDDLGVHPAVEAGTGGQLPDLPPYVPRDHDAQLRQVAGKAAGGASQLVVVVGGSSTGKTRACREMLASLPGPARKTRPLRGMLASLRGRVPQWLLWHPIYPTPPEAVLTGLGQAGPRTVVWLDEAQRYLDTPDDSGERVAAGLRELLGDPRRRPVLVVATLWSEYGHTLTTRADPDRHAQARELLSGHKIDAPESFSPAALSKLAEEAGTDPRLAEAADQAVDGQITQYLAGAPCLLHRYEDAQPGARALILAAMDARRLGCGPYLPLALLEGAAPGYLTDTEWPRLGDHWLDRALAYATGLCDGIPGPLTRIRSPGPDHAVGAPGTGHDGTSLYRLADYLDQYGRRHRHALVPRLGFWTAAPCAQPADLTTLATAARDRGLYRAAAQLFKSAAARGDPRAGADLIDILHDLHPGDHRPAQWLTVDVALDLGDPLGVISLLDSLRQAGAAGQVTALAKRAAAHVHLDDPSVASLLHALRWAGAPDQATALAERAAAHVTVNDPGAVASLLGQLRLADAPDQATTLLAERAAAHAALDDPDAMASLLHTLQDVGAQDQVATLLARDPAAHAAFDNPYAVGPLVYALREAGAQDQATALAERAAAHVPVNDPSAVDGLLRGLREAGADEQVATLLARDPAAHAAFDDMREVAGLLYDLQQAGADEQVATLLARDPAAHVALDDPDTVNGLLYALREAGAREQVAALLARDPAAHVPVNDPRAVTGLLYALREAGAPDQATALAERAAAHVPVNDPSDVGVLLAGLREAGAPDQATALAERAAAHVPVNDPSAVAGLLHTLREAGAPDQVDTLLARDPAAHAALDDPSAVGSLLVGLREAGAWEQVDALLARDPAAHVHLDKPRAGSVLLDRLREADAQDQVTILVDRWPGEGLFYLFRAQGNHQALYRFGRNPDGRPAEPWGWEDLN